MRTSRRSTWTKRLLLLFVSVTMTLLAAEGLLRLTGRFPSRDLHTVNAREFMQVPGIWEPQQDFVSMEKAALRHHVRTNALGLRGPETSRAPQTRRILCIGDSFTYGDFVDNEQTLPAQLQACLGTNVEVLNGGVRGSTIVDQQVFLDRLLALEPQAVVLTYCENDLQDLRRPIAMHEQLARDRELKSGLLAPVFAIARDTCLFRLGLLARKRLKRSQAPSPAASVNELLDTQVQRYVELLVAMRDKLQERDIDFHFVVYPSHQSLDPQGDSTLPAVIAAAAQEGIEAINPTAALRQAQAPVEALYLLPHDPHPSPLGYQITAQVVAAQLR